MLLDIMAVSAPLLILLFGFMYFPLETRRFLSQPLQLRSKKVEAQIPLEKLIEPPPPDIDAMNSFRETAGLDRLDREFRDENGNKIYLNQSFGIEWNYIYELDAIAQERISQGRFREAADVLIRLVTFADKKKRNVPRWRRKLGSVYESLGDLLAAINCYEAAHDQKLYLHEKFKGADTEKDSEDQKELRYLEERIASLRSRAIKTRSKA